MCGIFGFSKLQNKVSIDNGQIWGLTCFLAVMNETRGDDSTGICYVNGDGSYVMARRVLSAPNYLNVPAMRCKGGNALSGDLRHIIGHTRFATTGAVNLTNAMPFVYGRVIGSHNGVISNYDEIGRVQGFQYKTDCDSESLFALANRFSGDFKGYCAELRELRGYFSIALVDTRKVNSIFLARSTAPLSIWIDKAGTYLFWTSERDHAEKAIAVFGLDCVRIKIGENRAVSVGFGGTRTWYKVKRPAYDYGQYNIGYGSALYPSQYDRYGDYKYQSYKSRYQWKKERKGKTTIWTNDTGYECDYCRKVTANMTTDADGFLICPSCLSDEAQKELYSG